MMIRINTPKGAREVLELFIENFGIDEQKAGMSKDMAKKCLNSKNGIRFDVLFKILKALDVEMIFKIRTETEEEVIPKFYYKDLYQLSLQEKKEYRDYLNDLIENGNDGLH